MRKKLLFKIFIILFVVVISSCKQDHEISLQSIENLIFKNPKAAYRKLIKMDVSIKDKPDSVKMHYEILLCRAQDLCYVNHKSDSIMKNVIKYYEANHNQKYLMQAYYCMGCIYRDLYQSSKALDFFHKALNLSAYSRNYSLIARIYNQIGEIQTSISSYSLAKEAYKKALYYFIKANDIRTIPFSALDIAYICIDEDKGKYKYYIDIANQYSNKLHDRLLKLQILLRKTQLQMYMGDYNDAYKIMNEIKYKYPDICYKQQGFYLIHSQIDYYNKHYYAALKHAYIAIKDKDNNNRYYSYLLLSNIYNNGFKNYKKSLDYAVLGLNLMDTIREAENDKDIRRMQYLYNYEKTQKENAQLTLDNIRSKQYLGIVVIFVLLTLIVIILIVFRIRKRNEQLKKTVIEKQNMYEMSLKRIYNNETEISRLKQLNDKISKLKIQILEKSNNRLKENIKNQDLAWIALRDSPIYCEMHNMVKNGELQCSHIRINEMLVELEKTVDFHFDNFCDRLRSYYPPINDTQIKICYLLKAEFKLSDIATMISYTRSSVTNARTRMMKNCFDSKSTLDDFDHFIHDL